MTTSATIGHEKLHLMNNLMKFLELQILAKNTHTHTQILLQRKLEKLSCLLYGKANENTLTSLRYTWYMTMMAKSNRIGDYLLLHKMGLDNRKENTCHITTDLDVAPPRCFS